MPKYVITTLHKVLHHELHKNDTNLEYSQLDFTVWDAEHQAEKMKLS